MINIWMLTAANLRKNRGQTLSTLILIVIVSMLLNIGMVMYFGMSSFLNERAEELNAAHFATFQTENYSLDTQLDFIRGFSGVTEIEEVDILRGAGGYFLGESLMSGTIIIADGTAEQQINPPTPIRDYLPLTDNAIYIPHFVFLAGDFALGDDIRLEIEDTELTFTVAGSSEDIMFGSNMFTIWRFYVSEQTFLELQGQFSESNSVLLAARMTEGWAELATEYRAVFGADFGGYFGGIVAQHDYFISSRTAIPLIAAIVVVVFSLILLIVSSIVTRFRISNDIEEGMTNIGSLKAIGYSSYQIIMSIVLQFSLIAFIGGIVGILLAYMTFPVLTGPLLEPMLGLPWNPVFNLSITLVALSLIMLMVFIFAFFTANRINKLHPIIALRGGITTHSFKKNSLPLDKTRGSLSFLIAVKHILNNKKQAIMLFIIIGAVSFSSVSVLTMHYNTNINIDVFVSTVIGDVPDLTVSPHNREDGMALRQRMENRPEVSSVFGIESILMQVDNAEVSVMVLDDFSNYTGYSLVDGRFPLLYSEIVLDVITLSTIDKSIGDWVTIRSGDNEYQYIITGSIQLMGSFIGMMKIDGLHHVQPDFTFNHFGLFLVDGVDVLAFIETIRTEESDIVASTATLQGFVNNVVGMVGNLFAALSIGILLIVASIVILVLYLIIKTVIIRRKREIGIQKAFGFTTFQLMNQIALNMTPIIVLGVVIGTISGYVSFSPIFVAVMRNMGVVQADLPVPINWIVMASVGLIILAYAVSMLIAWRIRKISAYSLVSE